MRRWAKIAIAGFLAVMLAVFGISQIGGDTWVTASAPLPDGFMRAHAPLPVERGEFRALVPAIMLLALALGSLAHAYLRRPAESDDGQDSRM